MVTRDLLIVLYFVFLGNYAAQALYSGDTHRGVLAVEETTDGFVAKTLDKLASWLPGLDTLNPSFGKLGSRSDSDSIEGSPLVVKRVARSRSNTLEDSVSKDDPGLDEAASPAEALVAADDPAEEEASILSRAEAGKNQEQGQAQANKNPLPALGRVRRAGRPKSARRQNPARTKGQYRHHFQDASGFNESLAARDGQPVNASDLSHIAATGVDSTGLDYDDRESGVNVEDTSLQLPMVALMFLTRGSLPHEATWRLFLESIPDRGASRQMAWESMFSLYVHPGLEHNFSAGSLMFGKAISNRVAVEWGQFSVMQAEINLMQEALKQPLNERFVLLSETCIPLYPASLVWAQLLSEARSRMHACAKPGDSDDENRRMTYRMHQDMEKDGLKREHWRKSGQWSALVRRHAQVVSDDTIVSKLFKDECWVDTKNQPIQRFCVSDEHYTPTLLAFLGLDNETDCVGSVTNAWWDGPYFHPRTWEAKDISQTLINQLRKSNHGFEATEGITCDYEDALQSLKAVFPSLEVPKPQSRHSRALLGQTQVPGLGTSHSSAKDKGQATLLGDPGFQQILLQGRAQEFWQQLAVLYPGSLAWWKFLDDRGIDGDLLLPTSSAPHGRQLQQSLKAKELPMWVSPDQGAHWAAARQLLGDFRPMADTNCPLFARKFAADDAGSIALLAKNFTDPMTIFEALNQTSQQ